VTDKPRGRGRRTDSKPTVPLRPLGAKDAHAEHHEGHDPRRTLTRDDLVKLAAKLAAEVDRHRARIVELEQEVRDLRDQLFERGAGGG
jgi:hypothetical protein